ncbi:pyridoxamine 5-phosphate oxidase [Bacillus sp. SRB_336]|nr:pyridoxamine 5-phosphate oxidase [Bacillus sp. SRB_336]
MTNYAVFLRGINVGGINIKMADLRLALEALPVTDVKTLLASGNFVCAAETTAAELKALVEDCLREKFGYDAWVVVLDQSRLTAIIDACPYPSDNKEQHSYVTLSSDTAILDELETLGGALAGVEQARLSPEALAWLAPAGGTLDSPFSKLSAKAKYKSSTTTRNLRTLLKCRDALA